MSDFFIRRAKEKLLERPRYSVRRNNTSLEEISTNVKDLRDKKAMALSLFHLVCQLRPCKG
jgi:hypothetical protein